MTACLLTLNWKRCLTAQRDIALQDEKVSTIATHDCRRFIRHDRSLFHRQKNEYSSERWRDTAKSKAFIVIRFGFMKARVVKGKMFSEQSHACLHFQSISRLFIVCSNGNRGFDCLFPVSATVTNRLLLCTRNSTETNFCVFPLQRPDENLDVSLSVPQYNGHPPPSHLRYHNLNDQVREQNEDRKKLLFHSN